ncbi:hypothetical protein HN587_02845 [Candidatus Woesearchaeota archaeon]|jgi:hypothetical protein|nr:hypothetical protein [Candidatus Woesearchaeota archaeon]
MNKLATASNIGDLAITLGIKLSPTTQELFVKQQYEPTVHFMRSALTTRNNLTLSGARQWAVVKDLESAGFEFLGCVKPQHANTVYQTLLSNYPARNIITIPGETMIYRPMEKRMPHKEQVYFFHRT